MSTVAAWLDPAASAPVAAPRLQRWRLRVSGVVQGVGFRPWCAQTAQALGLSGWVCNDPAGAVCELQGPVAALQDFVDHLRTQPPTLARVGHVEQHAVPWQGDEAGFAIRASARGAAPSTRLPPDTAPCDDCLCELLDPADRRWRHAFINCTHCGPRFTLTERLPYDRADTSMADFAMCPACEAEYTDPANRRYHAQPVACPQCGPRLALWRPDGTPLPEPDPLAAAAARLAAGEIVAIKSVGGYHLVCDAHQAAPVQRLRQAKQRGAKPFALLVANVASARQWVDVSDAAAELLTSPARPIVLLPRRASARLDDAHEAAHEAVAPGLDEWGMMLPSAPLHTLLLHELLGRPSGAAWLHEPHTPLLVMTSANPSGEPLVTDEADAVQRLAGLADALLVHDRAIVSGVDDSVRRPLSPTHAPFVRRARGHVPDPIALPGVDAHAPSVLALGGWMKATVCLTRGNEAFVSQHIGDLGHPAHREALVQAVQRLQQFLGVAPTAVRAIAHDLHPDFFSTHHAARLSAERGVPLCPVQHHRAHAAAVLAEHGESRPALALVLDGVGLGDDGQAWGGELLLVDAPAAGLRTTRLAHLPLLALPGGDRAATEPWRLGAAVLASLGRADEIATRYADQRGADTLAAWLRSAGTRPQAALPSTTSAGRWFDAAASLLGLVQHQSFEAEAAMRLEACAAQAEVAGVAGATVAPWPDAWSVDAAGALHWPGLLARLAQPVALADRPAQAAAFHATLVAAWSRWVVHHAQAQGVPRVVLAGGCFINRLLRNGLVQALQAAGLTVLEPLEAPPGDGGLSLGQAAVALSNLTERLTTCA
jgi:hydrogenase maturation protein HypF